MEEEYRVLRSYNKLKGFENKVYRLGNTRTPIPIPINTSIYFIGAMILVALIDGTIGIHINFIYKYLALPLAITYLAKNRKIDGKVAHKYFVRLIKFQFIKKSRIERFEVRENIKGFTLVKSF